MQIELINTSITKIHCDTLVVGIFHELTDFPAATAAVDEALNGMITTFVKEHKDVGKFGSITALRGCVGVGAKTILLTGLGKQQEVTRNTIRSVTGNAIRAAIKEEAKTVATSILGAGHGGCDSLDAVQAIAEGSILGGYKFNLYKTEAPKAESVEKLYIIATHAKNILEMQNRARDGELIARAVNTARDMVNHPANYLTPTRMAGYASEIAQRLGLPLDVLDKKQIEALKMNAFLAVAQGSDEPPKLIVLHYTGAPDDSRQIAFIGKGITFDSGGISLKPSEGMQDMKDDMAGGAAVLAATQAIAELKLPINLLTIVPCTENMPSGHAFRPGDVITSMNGKTIEVISTDAEGRLILADAITYAIKLGATHIIDLATLTGACVVALGNVASGLTGNDLDWKRQLFTAAADSGEKMWELPLFDEYKEQIKSDIADIKNTGGRPAGAITAALFLAAFAGQTPWIHLDIAGTVTSSKDNGYNAKGATGVGVRTLIRLAQNFGNQ
jgi:leucyl aminopeptidase